MALLAGASLRVLLPHAVIEARVRELAGQIDRDYPDGVHLVCILKGACFFLTDLARAITRPVRIDFLAVSSYGANRASSGEVKLTKDLDHSIEGHDVLLVEDIVDSGLTLHHLVELLQARRPRSLRIVALLDKSSRRIQPVEVAYVGFEIPDEFVVGYGLDYAELYRNLPDLCVLENGD